MATNLCEHNWERNGVVRSHFQNEPNSKRRYKDVAYVRCDKCKWLGFRYIGYKVLYTWDPNEANWITE